MKPPLLFAEPWGLVLLPVLVWIYLRYRRAHPAGARPLPLPLPLPLTLRCAVFALLALAASGLRIPARAGGQAVAFVLDVSASVPEGERAAALARIGRATASMGDEDRAGLVVFAGAALVELPLDRSLRPAATVSVVETGASDLAAGIELATQQLAQRERRRIVLLSDGNQNVGDALAAAARAAAGGTPIDVIPLAVDFPPSAGEVLVEGVTAPERVGAGAPFEVGADLRATAAAPVVARLEVDGRTVDERRTTLEPGTHRLRFTRRLAAAGLHELAVAVESPADAVAENNRAAAAVHVAGPPRIGCLCRGTAVPALLEMLARDGFAADRLEPGHLTPPRLAPYDAVVMHNSPAGRFSGEQLVSLAGFVETGGGLLMTGSVGSFGPGGFAGTPVERVLPVDLAPGDRMARPRLALVLVLDKSGSMAADDRGASKLERAKEAALSVLDHLQPQDALGILAFDRDPRAVVPLQPRPEAETVEALLAAIEPAGGTRIEAAVEEAHGWLTAASGERKHLLLLSDGRGETSGRERLAALLADSPVVVSAVAIGDDVDRDYLRELTATTGGRAYFAARAEELSEIFARETLRIAGDWLREGRARPVATGAHPILAGIGVESMPAIEGFVSCRARDDSRVVLAVDPGQPLLATWRYGLGRTAVLTTDLFSTWTAELSRWPQLPDLWSQTVRWVARRLVSRSLAASVRLEGSVGEIVVDAYDDRRRFANGARIVADVRAPDGTIETVELEQVGPGRYAGRFRLGARGLYRLQIAGSGGGLGEDETVLVGVDAWTLPEYRRLGVDLPLLQEIARRSGGSLLGPDDDPFAPGDSPPGYRDLWRPAALAALVLFALEVLLRRRRRRDDARRAGSL